MLLKYYWNQHRVNTSASFLRENRRHFFLQEVLTEKSLPCKRSRNTCRRNLKARFHYERGKKHSLFVLLLFFALASILTARFNRRSIKETKNALFHYEREKEHSLFVLLIFFALVSILTARFNRRSIIETKNALFHARSGNGPLIV